MKLPLRGIRYTYLTCKDIKNILPVKIKLFFDESSG